LPKALVLRLGDCADICLKNLDEIDIARVRLGITISSKTINKSFKSRGTFAGHDPYFLYFEVLKTHEVPRKA